MKKLILILIFSIFPILFFEYYYTKYIINDNNVLFLFIYFLTIVFIVYYKKLSGKIALMGIVCALIYAISFGKDIYNWNLKTSKKYFFYEQSFFCNHILSIKLDCDFKEFKIDNPENIFEKKNYLKFIKTSTKKLAKPSNGLYRVSYEFYIDSYGNKLKYNHITREFEDGW